MKTNLRLLVFLTFFMLLENVNVAFAQNDEQANLQKYWNYRDRYKKWFTRIGGFSGQSLPASIKTQRPCSHDNGTEQLHFGDVGAFLGDYIGVLATEYKLLKDAQQDTKGTESELYYALNAINRLDGKVERYFDASHLPTIDLNGFFMRDDVADNFSVNWSELYPLTNNCRDDVNCIACDHFRYVQNGGGALDGSYDRINNEESQDQMIGLILGLAHVVKLVDNPHSSSFVTRMTFNVE